MRVVWFVIAALSFSWIAHAAPRGFYQGEVDRMKKQLSAYKARRMQCALHGATVTREDVTVTQDVILPNFLNVTDEYLRDRAIFELVKSGPEEIRRRYENTASDRYEHDLAALKRKLELDSDTDLWLTVTRNELMLVTKAFCEEVPLSYNPPREANAKEKAPSR